MGYGHIVLASTKNGFVPNAIKWFTKSKFSHSLITIPEILGIPMGIEAAESGVDAVRFDKNYVNDPSQGYEIWKVNVSQEIKDKAISQVLNDLQVSYGFLEYPWFMWRGLNRFFGRDIKSQNNWNTSGMICSELCVEYLTACGLESYLAGYGKGSIAPQDLQDIMRAHPELFEKIESVRLEVVA